MPIYRGANAIGEISRGSNEIAEIYIGTNLVYSSSKKIVLGSGTSWDIKNLYPNLYSKLTANNFFARSAGQAAGANSIRMRDTDTEREWAGFSGGLAKSYDPSTGILSLYNYISPGSSNGSAIAVMVTKPDKLIDLGIGSSFNVSSYSGYQNFTADNFLIRESNTASGGNSYYPQGYTYDDSGSGTVNLVKSYNSSTGVLSCYINLVSRDTSGVYSYFNFTSTATVRVFLSI